MNELTTRQKLWDVLARHAYDIKQGGDIHHDFALQALLEIVEEEQNSAKFRTYQYLRSIDDEGLMSGQAEIQRLYRLLEELDQYIDSTLKNQSQKGTK